MPRIENGGTLLLILRMEGGTDDSSVLSTMDGGPSENGPMPVSNANKRG
jgi:hypothetical protein